MHQLPLALLALLSLYDQAASYQRAPKPVISRILRNTKPTRQSTKGWSPAAAPSPIIPTVRRLLWLDAVALKTMLSETEPEEALRQTKDWVDRRWDVWEWGAHEIAMHAATRLVVHANSFPLPNSTLVTPLSNPISLRAGLVRLRRPVRQRLRRSLARRPAKAITLTARALAFGGGWTLMRPFRGIGGLRHRTWLLNGLLCQLEELLCDQAHK